MRESYTSPFIIVGNHVPMSPQETIHRYAIEHGLPEIRGYWGYDFAGHEFIRLADADKAEVDVWPSRRLQDVLSELPR